MECHAVSPYCSSRSGSRRADGLPPAWRKHRLTCARVCVACAAILQDYRGAEPGQIVFEICTS